MAGLLIGSVTGSGGAAIAAGGGILVCCIGGGDGSPRLRFLMAGVGAVTGAIGGERGFTCLTGRGGLGLKNENMPPIILLVLNLH